MVKEAVEEAKKTASAQGDPGDGEIPVEDGEKEEKAGADGQEESEEASPEEDKAEGKEALWKKEER